MKKHVSATLSFLTVALALMSWPSEGFVAPGSLSGKAFTKPDLKVSTEAVPLQRVKDRLANGVAWNRFMARHLKEVTVFIDPRSGAAASILAGSPLIPGTGRGNKVSLPVSEITPDVVAEVTRQYVLANRDVIGIDPSQLGEFRANPVSDSLWQVTAPQVRDGIPVRGARLGATLNHGNLTLLGTTMWGTVETDSRPAITTDEALRLGFAYAGGRMPDDIVRKVPLLEFVPYAPLGREAAYQPGGEIGRGYKHRLVWSFSFERSTEDGLWEVLVDAHSGEVVELRDTTESAQSTIKGGVYPETDTEYPAPSACLTSDWTRCGVMQSNYPMPWADTGLASPNNFTNSAGAFNYTSGPVVTTLHGKYYMVDTPGCPPGLSESASGDVNLGGVNGQHRCDSSGLSAGDVPAARNSYYATNRIAEVARGWLPNNSWLSTIAPNQFLIQAITPVVHRCQVGSEDCPEAGGCEAYYHAGVPPNDPSRIYFEPGRKDILTPGEPWICRPFGEIPSIVDHEWGHALDDNDSGGNLSNTTEAYADIAAIYREGASCVGRGAYAFDSIFNQTCGTSSDGTGYNQTLEFPSATPHHCFTDCNGLREADYHKHSDNQPDTPQNFVCSRCSVGSNNGPCGRETHCEAAPVDQAAWDLVSSDLRTSPFYLDAGTALTVGNKLFYQGSGNVSNWYSCDCAAGTSSGCAWDTGYMQWLAADDDNGFTGDGTPHMTAIYNAFNRHGIACTVAQGGPTPQNGGCASGPTGTPTLRAIQGNFLASLSWSAVTGATKYWVFRSEGVGGCNLGKAKIIETTATTAADLEVANGRLYSYSVMPVGSSNSCFGMSSVCMKPEAIAGSDYQTQPGEILSGTYEDTQSSNDVRESLRETLQGSVYRLVQTWKFDNVAPGGQQPRLAFEGNRPAVSGTDNFQFYYCSPTENASCPTSDASFTAISGALIFKAIEQIGAEAPFGSAGLSGTIYIRLVDTVTTSDNTPNTVNIDYLAIRPQE